VRRLTPASDGSRWRAPSRHTLICLGLCALILGLAAADLVHTTSRLPEVSADTCFDETPACRNAALSEQLARLRAAEPLQDQFNSRAWLYAFAILAIGAVTVAYELRSRPRTDWLRIFTNLGVIGVWLGIGATLLLVVTDGNSLTPPPAPTLLLPVALLVAAAAGTLIGRSEGWAETSQTDGIRERVVQLGRLAIHVGTAGQARRSRLEELARWLTLVALSLTALTWLFVLASVLGGMAAAIGALVLRRWVVALVSITACPVALLLVLVSTCAFH
jgi:hypothetical protein